MASLNPSPHSTSIRDLLFRFGESISDELLSALEGRDDEWRTKNKMFRSQIQSLSSKRFNLNRSLEEARNVITRLKEEDRRLWLSMRGLKEEERSRKEEFDREREKLEADRLDMDRIIDGLQRERAQFVMEIRQLKSKKDDEIDMLLKKKRELETDLERAKSDEIWRNLMALEAENEEVHDKMRRILNDNKSLENENGRLQEEVKKKIPQLVHTIQVLKKEKGEREAELHKAKIEQNTTTAKTARIVGEKISLEAEMRMTNGEKSRILNEKNVLEAHNSRMKEEILNLVYQIQGLKTVEREHKNEIERIMKEKTDLDMEKRRAEKCLEEEKSKLKRIEDLEREQKTEIERIIKEKTDLDMEKRRAEECLEEEKSKFKRIQVLERDQKIEIERIMKENNSLETENGRLEEEVKKKIPQLVHTIHVLKKENGEREAELHMAKIEQSTATARIMGEKIALEAEIQKTNGEKSSILNEKNALEAHNSRMKEVIFNLVDKIRVLETVKGEQKTEIERIMKEITDLNMEKRRAEEYLEEEKSKLKRFEVLEREQKTEIERIIKEKTDLDMEKRRAEECLEEEKSKLKQIEVLEREHKTEIERIMKEKTDLDMEKRRADECLEEEKSKLKRIEVLERDKTALESKVSKMEEKNCIIQKSLEAEKNKIWGLVKKIEDLEKEKGELEAEVCKAKKDKNDTFERIGELNKALEAEKNRAKKAKNPASGTLKKIGVLKRKTESLEAKILKTSGVLEKVKKEMDEKSEEIKRLMNEKKALEARNRDLEEEVKEKVSKLVKRIEILKVKKKKMKAKVCQANNEKNAEIKRISVEKEALEEEKRAVEDEGMKKGSELVKRIEVLEEEKKEMEALVFQAKKEKDEEIHRILNEKKAIEDEKRVVKEDYHKMMLVLDDRNDILESEKQGFEAEVTQRDEVIKVLKQEISCLENRQKELETEINLLASKLKEEVHFTNNAVTVSTPRQKEGQTFAGMGHSSENSGRDDDNGVENSDGQCEDKRTHKNLCKRKRSIGICEQPAKKIHKPACAPLLATQRSTDVDVVDVKPVLLPCQKNKEMNNTTRCTKRSNGGDVQVESEQIACEWQVDQDVLDAFDAHPELCLKAVCALYRLYKRLGSPENTSLSPDSIVLAEFLIDEDPEGRKTKKMVAKLDKFDRDAVGECIRTAKQHYKQVFQMYKKKEDPVFLP